MGLNAYPKLYTKCKKKMQHPKKNADRVSISISVVSWYQWYRNMGKNELFPHKWWQSKIHSINKLREETFSPIMNMMRLNSSKNWLGLFTCITHNLICHIKKNLSTISSISYIIIHWKPIRCPDTVMSFPYIYPVYMAIVCLW